MRGNEWNDMWRFRSMARGRVGVSLPKHTFSSRIMQILHAHLCVFRIMEVRWKVDLCNYLSSLGSLVPMVYIEV